MSPAKSSLLLTSSAHTYRDYDLSEGIAFELHAYEALLATSCDLIRLESEVWIRSSSRTVTLFDQFSTVSPVVQVYNVV